MASESVLVSYRRSGGWTLHISLRKRARRCAYETFDTDRFPLINKWYASVVNKDYRNPTEISALALAHKIMHDELRTRGWTCMKGVKGRSELLELARAMGRPVPSPTGELVKELTPKPETQARKGTLSNKYSTGTFPLHTDTAFWSLPSRYLVFRARGDVRRHTTILTFADLFRQGAAELRAFAECSVWLVRTPSESIYCSMKFLSKGHTGWRYDPQCMSPVNDAAFKVREWLDSVLECTRVECIPWTSDLAVVLCNWEVLHGRGPSPPGENKRILERIYVE